MKLSICRKLRSCAGGAGSYITFYIRCRSIITSSSHVCSTQEYYVSVSVCLSFMRMFRLMQIAFLEFETLRCLHQVQNVSEKSAHWQDKQVISDFHFPYNWVGSRSKLPFVNGTIIEDCPLYRCLRTQDVYQRLLLFPPKTFSWQQTHY